ncbi:MAG: thermonuclease family protein, partial [Gammaproteobacteria bacterium]|nr:thermonuclease family protein [Gammaproteobacteria bacterium]
MRLFLCPWMDGIAQRAWDGGAHMPWMDGIAQRARDGGAHMSWMDGIQQGARTTAHTLILLVIQAALVNTALADTACPATQFDEKSRVSYAYDGDTLHLKDGRKVRLIGINTPEIGHDNNADEPFANEARAALKSIIKKDKSISLIYGKEKKDHYQRLLAHAFTSDGQNIQALLLTNGFARVITFPPNTQFTACYLAQERNARCSKTGLWKTAITLEAKLLDKSDTGFHLVEGKLNSINTNEKGIWLNLDNQ